MRCYPLCGGHSPRGPVERPPSAKRVGAVLGRPYELAGDDASSLEDRMVEIHVAVADATGVHGLVRRLAGVFDRSSVSFDGVLSEVSVRSECESRSVVLVLDAVEAWLEKTASGRRSCRSAIARTPWSGPFRDDERLRDRRPRARESACETLQSSAAAPGLALAAGSGALALAVSILAARRFADTPWPLSRGTSRPARGGGASLPRRVRSQDLSRGDRLFAATSARRRLRSQPRPEAPRSPGSHFPAAAPTSSGSRSSTATRAALPACGCCASRSSCSA